MTSNYGVDTSILEDIYSHDPELKMKVLNKVSQDKHINRIRLATEKKKKQASRSVYTTWNELAISYRNTSDRAKPSRIFSKVEDKNKNIVQVRSTNEKAYCLRDKQSKPIKQISKNKLQTAPQSNQSESISISIQGKVHRVRSVCIDETLLGTKKRPAKDETICGDVVKMDPNVTDARKTNQDKSDTIDDSNGITNSVKHLKQSKDNLACSSNVISPLRKEIQAKLFNHPPYLMNGYAGYSTVGFPYPLKRVRKRTHFPKSVVVAQNTPFLQRKGRLSLGNRDAIQQESTLLKKLYYGTEFPSTCSNWKSGYRDPTATVKLMKSESNKNGNLSVGINNLLNSYANSDCSRSSGDNDVFCEDTVKDDFLKEIITSLNEKATQTDRNTSGDTAPTKQTKSKLISEDETVRISKTPDGQLKITVRIKSLTAEDKALIVWFKSSSDSKKSYASTDPMQVAKRESFRTETMYFNSKQLTLLKGMLSDISDDPGKSQRMSSANRF